MIGEFVVGGRKVRVDFDRGTCIAIPLDFIGPQPNHFGAKPAQAEPMRAGGFIGDVRQGGSCNVPILTLNPHCNGTHTESVGHIVSEASPVAEAAPAGPVPATLITIAPVAAACSGETYRPLLQEGDMLITAAALRAELAAAETAWTEAIILRTLPNDPGKRTRRYDSAAAPAFFTLEAIDCLSRSGVRHLLVDLPSIDRMHDDGLLAVHRRFWNVPERTHALTAEVRRDRTISELIYVPDELPDGPHLLTIDVPAFKEHVAPSRPWLFPVEFV